LNLTFTNCDLSGADAGLFFTQTVGAGSLPEPAPGTGSFSLTVTNCLLHDFGATGGDFIDFRSGSFDKVTIKNSSIWKSARAFFRTDNTATAAGTNQVTIESCTFDAVCTGGAFIRVAAPGTKVAVTKCMLTNKTSNNNNSISGTGTAVTLTQSNIFGSNSANFSSVISPAPTGNTALDPGYAGASTGNFKVGGANAAAIKAAAQGDPRWLQ
jgi:hypothetical protein